MRPPELSTPEAQAKRIEGIRRAKAAQKVERSQGNKKSDPKYGVAIRYMNRMTDRDALRTARWVAESLERHGLDSRHDRDFNWYTAPSVEAMALLRWVLKDEDNEKVFWNAIWVKLLPNRNQIEQASRYGDDGAAAVELLERFEVSLAKK